MDRRLSINDWHPWAVLPEAMGALARIARVDLHADDIRAAIGQRQAVDQPRAPKGVAVIPLRGVITPRASLVSMLFGGGGGLEGFRSDLRAALADDEVGSILVDIDSPGGSTSLLTETAAEIRAASRKKPVVAVANTMAASAAYWLGSQADELVVTPSGEVGSIGVFAMHENYQGFNEKLGVDPTYISAGAFKTEGNPDEPLSDDGRAYFQQTINEFYDQFVGDVAKGRNVSPSKVKGEFGEGRMVTAKRAVAAGMADRVDTYERTLARLAAGPPERRDRSAETLHPDPQAGSTEQDPEHDNPEPNPTVEVGEEARARIAALVTARPSHVP